MKCPICKGDTKVQHCCTDGKIVTRFRKCKKCGHHYYTVESQTENAHDEFHRVDREYISKWRKERSE